MYLNTILILYSVVTTVYVCVKQFRIGRTGCHNYNWYSEPYWQLHLPATLAIIDTQNEYFQAYTITWLYFITDTQCVRCQKEIKYFKY